MIFEERKSIKLVGKIVGYLFSYFIFTTILFYVLTFLEKLPKSWTYFHVLGITFIIAIVGIGVERFLR